jgi:DNA-binding CsgD family transcriptional regulator
LHKRCGVSDVAKQVQELTAFLEVIRENESEALARVVQELSHLLEAKKTLAFGVRVEQERASLSFVHSDGDRFGGKLALEFNQLLASGKAPLLFNPAKPEANQRNVALALPPLLYIPTSGVLVRKANRGRPIHLRLNRGLSAAEDRLQAEQLLVAAGIQDDFILRALICDGSSLLAWLGIFQPAPPSDRQREIFKALLPALQKRLKSERLFGKSAFNAAALDLVLEKVASPALLITASGAIVHANSAGRVRASADWRGLEESLRRSLLAPGPESPYDLTRLSWAGAPDHYLAVQRPVSSEHATRVDEAAKRWRLRPQGARVLSRLVQGDANKSIAAKLGCAESTIELYVTQILRHAGVDSRAALIAKFWSQQ